LTQAGTLFLDELYKIKEKFSIKNDDNNQMMNLDDSSSNEDYEFLFPLKKMKKMKSNKTNSIISRHLVESNYLDTIHKQINEIKSKQSIQFKPNEPMQIEYTNTNNNNASLDNIQQIDIIVKTSTKQNLETNLNEHSSKINSSNERIHLIANSILNYEKEEEKEEEKQPDSVEICIDNLVEKKFSNQTTRCLVDILLDSFCHLDPQIISNLNPIEYQVLFELRNTKQSKSITQPFLLSLFIHQGDWHKLHNCVLFLLNNESTNKLAYNMNPTIVLDFLSSLIHIPELWKGTESKVTQKYNEENILVLTESQIFRLIDFILEEMCLNNNENELTDLKLTFRETKTFIQT